MSVFRIYVEKKAPFAAERDALRKEYVASVRANLTAQLDNTFIVEPDGTKHKLGKKE